jgi:hypothetical protein
MAEQKPRLTGRRLCKYRSMEEGTTRERTLAILKNLEIRYSPASRFNDPFDCHLDIAMRSTAEVEDMVGDAVHRAGDAIGSLVSAAGLALRKWMEDKGMKVPPRTESAPAASTKTRGPVKLTIKRQDPDGQWRRQSASALYNELQSQRMAKVYSILDESFGVLCLSERPDDILLWSHYGDSHRGVCLEFDVAAHPDVFARLHPVAYQPMYPSIPPEFPNLLEIFHDKAEGKITDTLLNVAHVLADGLKGDREGGSPEDVAALGVAHWFYVKSSRWKYEREWRCLKWKPGPQSFPPSALTRIIAGCVATEATLAIVREAIEGTPVQAVPLYKAVRKSRRFGLDIVPAA